MPCCRSRASSSRLRSAAARKAAAFSARSASAWARAASAWARAASASSSRGLRLGQIEQPVPVDRIVKLQQIIPNADVQPQQLAVSPQYAVRIFETGMGSYTPFTSRSPANGGSKHSRSGSKRQYSVTPMAA